MRVWPSRAGGGEVAAVEFDRVWPGEVWALRYAGRPAERRDEATQRSRDPAHLAALRSLGTRVLALACPSSLRRPLDLRDILGTDDGYAWARLWIEGPGRP